MINFAKVRPVVAQLVYMECLSYKSLKSDMLKSSGRASPPQICRIAGFSCRSTPLLIITKRVVSADSREDSSRTLGYVVECDSIPLVRRRTLFSHRGMSQLGVDLELVM